LSMAIFFLFLGISKSQAGMCPCDFGSKDKIRRSEFGLSTLRIKHKYYFKEEPQYEMPLSIHAFYKYHFNSISITGSVYFDKMSIGRESDIVTFYQNFRSYQLGVEKSVKMNRSLSFFYGVETFVHNYTLKKVEDKANNMDYTMNDRYQNFGLSGSIGLRYYLLDGRASAQVNSSYYL